MLEPIRAVGLVRDLGSAAGNLAKLIVDRVALDVPAIAVPIPPAPEPVAPQKGVAVPADPALLALIEQADLQLRGAPSPATGSGLIDMTLLPGADTAIHPPPAADPGPPWLGATPGGESAPPPSLLLSARQALTLAGIDTAIAALDPAAVARAATPAPVADPARPMPAALQAAALAEIEMATAILDPTRLTGSGAAMLVRDPAQLPTTAVGQQAWALAGMERAIVVLMAANTRASAGLEGRAPASAYRSALRLEEWPSAQREWAARIGARLRGLWPCADGHVLWSFLDDPPKMRAMVACLAEDGMAGPLADVAWEAVTVAETPRPTQLGWEAVVAAWLLTKTRHTLAELAHRQDIGLQVIGDVGEVLARARHAVATRPVGA